MSVVLLSWIKKSGVIDFPVLCLYCLTGETILEEKFYQAKQKGQQYFGIKIFYSKSSYGSQYKKNCISRFSVKIFMKRKPRAGKASPCRMFLSAMASVTYKIFF